MERSVIGRMAAMILASALLGACSGLAPALGPEPGPSLQQAARLPQQALPQGRDYAQRLAVARTQCIARRDGLSIFQAREFCGCLYDGFLADFTWPEVERLQQEFRKAGLGQAEQAELMKRNPKFALLTRRCASRMNDIAV